MAKINLKQYGITGTTEVIYNPSYDELYREETRKGLRGYEKGQVTEMGAVNVMTGVYTGRSPKDKFFVMDETTKDTIWWTSPEYKNDNKPVTKKTWKELKKIAVEELSNKKLFVVDTFCGANENTRLKIRFIMEVAWQAHFVKNMFIRPTDEELEKYADQVEAGLQTVSGTSYGGDIGLLLQMVKELLGSSDETIVKAGALIQKINGLCSAISEAGEDTARVVKELRSCTDQLVNLLDDTRVMIDTMDSYVPSMLDALGATEELMNRLAKAMGSTESVLRAVHNTLAAAGDSLDGGAKNTLAGMQELLNHSLTAIESLKQVREASRNMKDTLDEQLDKFEEENNFLNLDPGEDLVSFTSGKNPSPHSIQILLRTEEIDDEALSGDTADLEASAQADPGPLARIWNVLVKIVKAVVDIFKNR